MQILSSQRIGVQAGDVELFSDFEDGGAMWKGEGPRLARQAITFDEPFTTPPVVTVHITMMDMSNDAFIRADIQAEAVSTSGFDIVFRTWGDSRVARIRAGWQAIGAVLDEDGWDL